MARIVANDNPHSQRLISALRSISGNADADAFALASPLSKSADFEKKQHWAHDICHKLSAQYDTQTAASIRRACRCGDGKTMAREISDCIRKAGSLADGCALFTKQNKYAFLEYISDTSVLFGYHSCVCSCVKRSGDLLPLLWCECSAGYAEGMFRQIFGESVSVSLLGSIKSGSDRCRLLINW